MRKAERILTVLRERGQRGLPLERLYRLLFQRDLYLVAYAKLYRNAGAMTPGVTAETVDGMSLAKIDAIIESLRTERFRWTPVRRTYIPKKGGKLRPLGVPTWSDKLLQEVIRLLLEAYYEPQFSPRSHGFRPGRGCHTALRDVVCQGKGTKWFIEGDIAACFDRIDHRVLLDIVREKVHDGRFVRLLAGLLEAGYLEEWRWNATLSGTPQGGVVSPLLANLVLDRLDRYVEHTLVPANTRGSRRKPYRPYAALLAVSRRARRSGDRTKAERAFKDAQCLPSKEPADPNYRRLWYVRYADDFLLGFIGPKAEALALKQQLAAFLRGKLKLELSEAKTLVTHARGRAARFLGYEVHAQHADCKHDHHGRRAINVEIGLRVPRDVVTRNVARYTRNGKPVHLRQRVADAAYSIVAQYQAEYGGVVQYYRLAYNLGVLQPLKWAAEVSLVKTLAQKLRLPCPQVYRRFGRLVPTPHGIRKVLEVELDRGPTKRPLVARFGGIPLTRNPHVAMVDTPSVVWSGRSELVERLRAEKCELCGTVDGPMQVHHVRRLADLTGRSRWERLMAARRRKTLVVCHRCHTAIHNGRYDGPAVS
jgi:group II intron reverse transcriptase/maturase